MEIQRREKHLLDTMDMNKTLKAVIYSAIIAPVANYVFHYFSYSTFKHLSNLSASKFSWLGLVLQDFFVSRYVKFPKHVTLVENFHHYGWLLSGWLLTFWDSIILFGTDLELGLWLGI